MSHQPMASPDAPITDQLLGQLIAISRTLDGGGTVPDVDVDFYVSGVASALEELAVYRRLLGRAYAQDMVEGVLEAGPNVVRFPANRGGRVAPFPEGAA